MIPPLAVRLRRDFGAILNLIRRKPLRTRLPRGVSRSPAWRDFFFGATGGAGVPDTSSWRSLAPRPPARPAPRVPLAYDQAAEPPRAGARPPPLASSAGVRRREAAQRSSRPCASVATTSR